MESLVNNKTNCPVCNKVLVKRGIKNHIINSAKQEIWKNLEKQPHKEYYDTNRVEIDKSQFVFKV